VGKNVAVFVDVANVFYAAKAAGVDIDYVLLLKEATAGRDLVRAYAYTGLDPENENQRNFHSFLGRHGFKVVSKDIRKYGDGRVKANLDIELVVDMMKTARNLDVAVVVSGDGDFAPAIRAVQEMGVRVEVISFRGNTSADLMEVADRFTDITRLALAGKVAQAPVEEVAEEDLSMTAVPEKESAGPVRGRGRGRTTTRGREKPEKAEKADVAPAPAAAGRRRTATTVSPATAASAAPPAAAEVAGSGLVALPGEKLAKARPHAEGDEEATPAAPPLDEVELEEAGAEGQAAADASEESGAEGEAHRRRRRRRGGRGRGRGRAAEEIVADGEAAPEEPADEEAIAPSAPRPGAFGSVWDSQIGIPRAPRPVGTGEVEEIDEEEPEIPEYLLAERRRSQGRGTGRPRTGRGGAYAAAMERERFGRTGAPRYGEGARGGLAHGAQPQRSAERYPRRDARPAPSARPERAEGRSAEPWSEVPPELEEMLRAQLAQKIAAQTESGGPAGSGTVATNEPPVAGGASATPARRARRRTAPAEAPMAPAAPATVDEGAATEPGTPAPARRTRRTTATRTTAAHAASAPGTGSEVDRAPEPGAPAPVRRTRRTTAGAAPTAPASPEPPSEG
jgi:uncharacterized LabA/DUF88 family protein